MEPSCPWKEPSLTSKAQWPPPHLSAHPLLAIAVQDTWPGHEPGTTLSSERKSRGVSATLLLGLSFPTGTGRLLPQSLCALKVHDLGCLVQKGHTAAALSPKLGQSVTLGPPEETSAICLCPGLNSGIFSSCPPRATLGPVLPAWVTAFAQSKEAGLS